MPADANNKTVRDLPKLLALTGSLVEFTEKLLAETIRYSEDDHLAFMGLLSVSQQLKFLKSIRLLVENNLGAHLQASLPEPCWRACTCFYGVLRIHPLVPYSGVRSL